MNGVNHKRLMIKYVQSINNIGLIIIEVIKGILSSDDIILIINRHEEL